MISASGRQCPDWQAEHFQLDCKDIDAAKWGVPMLSQRVYESLPYLYLGLGLAILCSVKNPYAFSSALLFILAGAVVWVVRSEHRRIRHRLTPQLHGALPFWCYELLPFSYLTLGLSLLVYSENMLMYPSAVVLAVIGFQVWVMRALQRRPHHHVTPKRVSG